jgi:hypothetical protein
MFKPVGEKSNETIDKSDKNSSEKSAMCQAIIISTVCENSVVFPYNSKTYLGINQK